MLRCEWLIGLHQQDTVCLIKTAFLEYQGRFFFLTKVALLSPLPLLATRGHRGGTVSQDSSRPCLWSPLILAKGKKRPQPKLSFLLVLSFSSFVVSFLCLDALIFWVHWNFWNARDDFFFLSLERNLPTPRSAQGSPCWTSATNASVVPALLPN